VKTLIVYYSSSGNNRLLAATLRERLGCEAYELRPRKKRTSLDLFLDAFLYRTPPNDPIPYDVRTYDRVILVGPVWNARIAAPLRSFVRRHAEKLTSYAFITACAGRQGQAERLREELVRFAGRAPEALVELEAQAPLPPELRVGRNASKYRWQLEDMRHFASQIDRFIGVLGGPDSPPAHELAPPRGLADKSGPTLLH
jgi:hypothetical protein